MSDITILTDRLGCAAKIIGQPLATADNRRPQSQPSLARSLQLLEAVFAYLARVDIRLFRLPSNVCPYATHPEYPDLMYDRQVIGLEARLALLGRQARQQKLRLSFHPSQFILLNSPRPDVVERSIAELDWQCRLLDAMGMGDECRVFLHVGGVYDDRPGAQTRLLATIAQLPEHIQRRFGLENDDRLWSAAEVVELCQTAQVPMVFDLHHHRCYNHGERWQELLPAALATWPEHLRPKIHCSSPRDPQAAPSSQAFRAHSDYLDPDDVAELMCWLVDREPVDIMLEAKAKDLAVLALREWMQQSSCGD
jgi:UV DNA damage endonuclease